jgi:DNA-binding NtrC family response regulator
MSLPGLSGRELLAKAIDLDTEAKVILSTGYTQYSAESLGAKGLLKKPYRLTQALQTIREVLDE